MGSNLTHTVSGNVASFRSADKANIESLKVHFLPVQEGSGDPSPENIRAINGWNQVTIQQSTQNLFDFTTSTIIDGTNATHSLINDILVITSKGTSSSRVGSAVTIDWNIPPCLIGKTIRFQTREMINSNENHSAAVIAEFRDKNNTFISDPTILHSSMLYKNYTIPENATVCHLFFRISQTSGSTFVEGDSVIFKGFNILYPAVESNDYLYDVNTILITFPILGKNKFNPIYKNLDNYTVKGPYQYLYTEPIQLIPNTNYVLKPNSTGSFSNDSPTYWAIKTFDTMDTTVTSTSVGHGDVGYILNGMYSNLYGAQYAFNTGPTGIIRFAYFTGNKQTVETFMNTINIQLELGNTATIYEPYSSMNTVYGGYIDIAKGELVAEYEYMTDTWGNWGTVSDQGDGTELRYRKFTNPVLGNTQGTQVAYCNVAKRQYENQNGITHFYIVGNSYNCRIYLPSGTDTNLEVQVAGKLVTPIIYPLTPAQIKTFLNYNNIWSNTNDTTEVTYQVIDHLTQKRLLLPKQRRKVLWNQINGPIDADHWVPYVNERLSVTFSDGVADCEILTPSYGGYSVSLRNNPYPNVLKNHKYYSSYMVNPEYTGWFGLEFAGGYQVQSAYKANAGEWTRCSFLATASSDRSGANYIPFPSNGSYPSGVNPKFKLKSPIYIDLTKMFGPGNEPSKAEFEALCALNGIDLTQYQSQNTAGTEQYWYIGDYDSNIYKTVNWNQLAKAVNSSNYQLYNSDYATVEFNDGVATRTITQETTSNNCYLTAIKTKYYYAGTQGHIYYTKEELYSEVNKNYVVPSSSWTTRSITPNQWTTLENIFTLNSSSSQYIFICYRSSASDVGEVCSTRNPVRIDLTQMFGAGNEPSTPAEFRQICTLNGIDLDSTLSYTTGTKQLWRIK